MSKRVNNKKGKLGRSPRWNKHVAKCEGRQHVQKARRELAAMKEAMANSVNTPAIIEKLQSFLPGGKP